MHALKSIPRRVTQAQAKHVAALCGAATSTTYSRFNSSSSSAPSTSKAAGSSKSNALSSTTPLSDTLRQSLGDGKGPASFQDQTRLAYKPSGESSSTTKPDVKTEKVKKSSFAHRRERKKAKAKARAKAAASSKGTLDESLGMLKRMTEIAKSSWPPLAQTLTTAKSEVKESMAFTPISELVPEKWGGESWKDELVSTSLDDRSQAPHILRQEVIRTGTLEPSSQTLIDVAPRSEHQPVSTLAHSLDRVLFNPGVHWLQDPRSRVYNFTPYLEKIPKVNDFAFERLTGFVKSSRDEDLRDLAKQEGRKFAGSTSSLSGMLSHIYFLLSEYKDVDYSTLSQHFKNQPSSFTSGQRMPAMVQLNFEDGVYAIDSHTEEHDDPDKNVLTWMGTLLENFLTKSPEEFKKFMRFESSSLQQGEKPLREAYRYAKSKSFVMRSQLDCHDKRLPGTGVFDLKTRACVTVRMDILNHEENSGYMITNQHGPWQSFEKEYYDLIRSGFLKYSFQARIGNMDGVMVTYHNTERIFGFQYISLDEIDERLFGPTPGIGAKVFDKCVELLEAVVEEASLCFPKQSVKCSFETRMPGKVLEVYVQPSEWPGPEDEKPIRKLVVSLEHQLEGVQTRAHVAMRQPDSWTVQYQIGRASLSDEDIRRDFRGLENRKKRQLVLPSSVGLEDAETYWESLNYSNKVDKEGIVPKTFSIDSFSLANSAIEKYRELAREGRLLSQKLAQEEAGRPKIVLGEGVYNESDTLFFKEPLREDSS